MSKRLPLLLTSRQLEDHAGISDEVLQSMQPNMHLLLLPGNMLRYSLRYAQILRPALAMSPSEQPNAVVRRLAASVSARTAIKLAELELRLNVSDKLARASWDERGRGIRVEDLAQCLYIAETEDLPKWIANGTLPAYEQNGVRYIGESIVRHEICWVRPQDYPGSHTAEVLSDLQVTENPYL